MVFYQLSPLGGRALSFLKNMILELEEWERRLLERLMIKNQPSSLYVNSDTEHAWKELLRKLRNPNV
jgi:hypothetical protein